MDEAFQSLAAKQAFRRLEKLQWRVLQLHAISRAGSDRAVRDPDAVKRQIRALQAELDEVYRALDAPS